MHLTTNDEYPFDVILGVTDNDIMTFLINFSQKR